jgi:DNA-binding transcriptional ArsR family regulator
MTHSHVEIEGFGRGIGNPVRYRLVQALVDGPKTVHELTELVGLSQSAVSQHLSKLKTCRLVKDSRHGQEVMYTFNSWHVIGMLASLMHTFKKGKSSKTSKH